MLSFQISVCHYCCNLSASYQESESYWQTAPTSLQHQRPCRTVITIFGALSTVKGGEMQMMTLASVLESKIYQEIDSTKIRMHSYSAHPVAHVTN